MYYVGIDIGGMSIKFGLVNEEGAIIYRTVLTVDYNEVSIEKTISLMKDKIEELCTGAKIHLKDIKGIGIGCPGVCNTDEGILVNAPNLKWQDVHIREMFADLRIPTFICNDANVALIGEATCSSWPFKRAFTHSHIYVVLDLIYGPGQAVLANM